MLKDIRKDLPIPQSENEETNDDDDDVDEEDRDSKKKTQKQILQSIANIKSKLNSKGEIASLDDLTNFVNENKFSSESTNEVFVCDAKIGAGQNQPFCIVFSSKTCMKFLHQVLSSETPLLAIDATFKVNNLGYPLITVVSQDSHHEIYPIAFAPTTSESEETISFTLEALIKTYKLIYDQNFNLEYFMSDNAKCIFASAKKINGISNAKHLNCYFHLR